MNLAHLLASIAEGGASGADLAQRHGVSRSMIWKGVEALRAEGLQIAGEAGQGYTLTNASGFGRHTLAWRLGREVHFYSECGSTNQEARGLAEGGGVAEGTLVVTDHQTGGRGRLGRIWESQPGENLLFSLVLKPALPPQHAPLCVLAWAAAMAETIGCQVKWPNDLVTAQGKKLGGILAELVAEAEQVRFIVLGVGINVNQRNFSGLPDATSLALEGGNGRDRASLLADLVAAIEAETTEPYPDLTRWRALSHTIGRRVRVGDIEGMATGLRDDGALLVDGRAVLAGDVAMVDGE